MTVARVSTLPGDRRAKSAEEAQSASTESPGAAGAAGGSRAHAVPSPSPVTAAAVLFVAQHTEQAAALGDRLADLVAEPDQFLATLAEGLASIADPLVPDGIRSVTPGLGPVFGVRLPLLSTVHRRFARGTRRVSTPLVLDCTERALRHEITEVRWFGMWNFERLLATDPERTWQLMREAAAQAGEWITVDTLAHPYGAGILRDHRRWAEVGQLVYSPSRWERRLVGSVIATLPHVKSVTGGRDPENFARCLELVGLLIGDAEPDVQKALSWALRTLADLNRAATTTFVAEQADLAVASADGHRAWVLRDSLSKLSPTDAARIRTELGDIRRRPGTPPTSQAAATAAAFVTTATTATTQAAGHAPGLAAVPGRSATTAPATATATATANSSEE